MRSAPRSVDALAADPPGAPWYGFARITPRLADPGFCLKLRDSGCVMLKLGLESGDPAVLAALNKGIDLPIASPARPSPAEYPRNGNGQSEAYALRNEFKSKMTAS